MKTCFQDENPVTVELYVSNHSRVKYAVVTGDLAFLFLVRFS